MGRSISSSRSSAVGTLGGWVTDINTGEKLGLTSGHVVMGHRIGSLTSLPHTVHEQQIVQPADDDWVTIVQEAEKSRRLAYEKSSMCGSLNPKLHEIHSNAESKLQALKELKSSRGLGTVLFRQLVSLRTMTKQPPMGPRRDGENMG